MGKETPLQSAEQMYGLQIHTQTTHTHTESNCTYTQTHIQAHTDTHTEATGMENVAAFVWGGGAPFSGPGRHHQDQKMVLNKRTIAEWDRLWAFSRDSVNSSTMWPISKLYTVFGL